MSERVRPFKITEVESVYFLAVYDPIPVFHAYGDTDIRADKTVCGSVLYDTENRWQVVLPVRHALRFGRPCKRCFVASSGPGGAA